MAYINFCVIFCTLEKSLTKINKNTTQKSNKPKLINLRIFFTDQNIFKNSRKITQNNRNYFGPMVFFQNFWSSFDQEINSCQTKVKQKYETWSCPIRNCHVITPNLPTTEKHGIFSPPSPKLQIFGSPSFLNQNPWFKAQFTDETISYDVLFIEFRIIN